LIERLRCEAEHQFVGMKAESLGKQYKVGDKRTQPAVPMRGPFLDPQLWAIPLLLLQIIRQLIAPDILLDSVTVVVARPGAEEQHRHRDHGRLFE
jgi:hypothetical protein